MVGSQMQAYICSYVCIMCSVCSGMLNHCYLVWDVLLIEAYIKARGYYTCTFAVTFNAAKGKLLSFPPRCTKSGNTSIMSQCITANV